MRAIMRTAFTGQDNTSIDIGRVLWAGIMTALGVLQAHAVVILHQSFDPVQFATAGAALLAAGGAALRVKAPTEPPPG
jgi:hypothetical protein